MLFRSLARGKLDDAIEAAKPLVTVKASDVGAFRLVMAQGLAAAGRRDDALALLPDNDPDFATARELIRSGRRNIGDRMDVSKGVSWLFYRLADDLAVGGGQSMALNFARFAQFAEPGSALADLCAARQLLANGDPEASLAELGKIPVGSALAAAGDHGSVLFSNPRRSTRTSLRARASVSSPGTTRTRGRSMT